ncbi:MAG: hypothetical protein QXS24_06695 [Desulfurococcaceae archaeon]
MNDVKKLKLCSNGVLPSDKLNYRLIGSVYNLCYWFNDQKSYVFIPGKELTVAVLYFNGEYEIYSENCDHDDAAKRFYFTIGMNEDLRDLFELASRDPLLGDFSKVYQTWRLRSTDLWWGLVTSICQQNTSFKQGWRMLHNIVRNYNKVIKVGEHEVIRPPRPDEVLQNPDLLFVSGLGYRVKTMLNVAKAMVKNEVGDEYVFSISSLDAEGLLRSIKGVGPYTARLAIALSARKYDLPPMDNWLRKIISITYGIDEKFAEEFWIEKWGKWSALTSIMVTITLDAEPLSKAIQRISRRELLPKSDLSPTPINMKGFCEPK